MNDFLQGARIGIAMTGSFCTFEKVFSVLPKLVARGAQLHPILSDHVSDMDTRFYEARDVKMELTQICGRAPMRTIVDVEPIGPMRMLDLLIVAPCTGNTIAKIASGIADGTATMAIKSQLRNERPVLLALSTNDGLGANAANIGKLMARKHLYFVPYGQDDPIGKPSSLVFCCDMLEKSVVCALQNRQLQPVLWADPSIIQLLNKDEAENQAKYTNE